MLKMSNGQLRLNNVNKINRLNYPSKEQTHLPKQGFSHFVEHLAGVCQGENLRTDMN